MKTNKPFGIKFISAFSVVLGLSILIYNTIGIYRGREIVISISDFRSVVVMVIFVTGFLFVPVGIGIWKLKKWAWYGEIGLCEFLIILQLTGIIWSLIDRWPGPLKLEWQNLLIVFCIFSIWYLCRGKIWSSFEPKNENNLASDK